MIPVLLLVFALQPAAGDPSAAAPVPAPRTIDDRSQPLTGAVPQGSYEQNLRGAFSRTQSLQGPLDGTWVLKDAAGAAIYRFQLADPGFSGGRLEGAWQDLRLGSATDASGFFSGVARQGTQLILQFSRPAAGLTVITLDQRPEGYAGELKVGDKSEAVVLARP